VFLKCVKVCMSWNKWNNLITLFQIFAFSLVLIHIALQLGHLCMSRFLLLAVDTKLYPVLLAILSQVSILRWFLNLRRRRICFCERQSLDNQFTGLINLFDGWSSYLFCFALNSRPTSLLRNKINQRTRWNNFSSLLVDVYVRLNKFRASSCPSSGAQQLQ